ncbi:hypothetical protein QUA81_03535 [Microcoleus sp. F6_B4]
MRRGFSTPGGLCDKADKFSVGFRAIEFERNVRSGFLWMGDRVFGFMCDRVFGLIGAIGF